MLTYMYLDQDELECCSTYVVPQQSFKLQISLNYANIDQNAFS